MNIEDERKAFEAAIENKRLYQNKLGRWNGERYVFTKDEWTHKPLVQVLFETWLEAKAHVEEMANAYTVEGSPSDGYCVWGEDDFGNIYTVGVKHACEGDAKQWAKDNGYRVIDE